MLTAAAFFPEKFSISAEDNFFLLNVFFVI